MRSTVPGTIPGITTRRRGLAGKDKDGFCRRRPTSRHAHPDGSILSAITYALCLSDGDAVGEEVVASPSTMGEAALLRDCATQWPAAARALLRRSLRFIHSSFMQAVSQMTCKPGTDAVHLRCPRPQSHRLKNEEEGREEGDVMDAGNQVN